MSDSQSEERRMRQLMDAAVGPLLELIREHQRKGGNLTEIAGFVYDAEAARAAGSGGRGEVVLMPRTKAREIAQDIAPDHAHLLEGPAAAGRFHVVALVGELGAVVELSLDEFKAD